MARQTAKKQQSNVNQGTRKRNQKTERSARASPLGAARDAARANRAAARANRVANRDAAVPAAAVPAAAAPAAVPAAVPAVPALAAAPASWRTWKWPTLGFNNQETKKPAKTKLTVEKEEEEDDDDDDGGDDLANLSSEELKKKLQTLKSKHRATKTVKKVRTEELAKVKEDLIQEKDRHKADQFDKEVEYQNKMYEKDRVEVHGVTVAHLKEMARLQKELDDKRFSDVQQQMEKTNIDFQTNLKKVHDESTSKQTSYQQEMTLIKKHQTDMSNLQKQLDDSKHEAVMKVLQEQIAAVKAENAHLVSVLSERAEPVPTYVLAPSPKNAEFITEMSIAPLQGLAKEAEETAKKLRHMVETDNPGFLKKDEFWRNLKESNAFMEKNEQTFRDNARRLTEFQTVHFANTYRKFQNARNYVHQLVSQTLVHMAPKRKTLKKGT